MRLKLDQSVPFMESPNRLETDLGKMTAEERQKVVEVLVSFMREIRALACSAKHESPVVSYNQCESCAFNPACDSRKGFAPTTYGLLWAIVHNKPFVCHANQPTWKDNLIDTSKGVALCNGFKTITASKELSLAIAERAMQAIHEIVPLKK